MAPLNTHWILQVFWITREEKKNSVELRDKMGIMTVGGVLKSIDVANVRKKNKEHVLFKKNKEHKRTCKRTCDMALKQLMYYIYPDPSIPDNASHTDLF